MIRFTNPHLTDFHGAIELRLYPPMTKDDRKHRQSQPSETRIGYEPMLGNVYFITQF